MGLCKKKCRLENLLVGVLLGITLRMTCSGVFWKLIIYTSFTGTQVVQTQIINTFFVLVMCVWAQRHYMYIKCVWALSQCDLGLYCAHHWLMVVCVSPRQSCTMGLTWVNCVGWTLLRQGMAKAWGQSFASGFIRRAGKGPNIRKNRATANSHNTKCECSLA